MSYPIEFEIGRLTHRGRVRWSNEDWLEAYVPPEPYWRMAKGAVFVVADGIQRDNIGHIASQLAGGTTIHEYYNDASPHVAQSLERAVRAANWRVYQGGQRGLAYQRMGTTLVAAVVRGDELTIANVGDSRAYLARGPWFWQITRDHSWVAEEIAAGGLTWGEAQRHPWRKMITRAVGSYPDVRVDTFRVLIQPGDVLVLASDGLTDEVGDREIWQTVMRYGPQQAAGHLVGLANRRGGRDNITVLVVRVRQPAWQPMAHPAYAYQIPSPAWPGRVPMAPPRRLEKPSLAPLAQLAGGLAAAAYAIVLAIQVLATGGPGNG